MGTVPAWEGEGALETDGDVMGKSRTAHSHTVKVITFVTCILLQLKQNLAVALLCASPGQRLRGGGRNGLEGGTGSQAGLWCLLPSL